MKLLAFVDLHSDFNYLNKLIEKAKEACRKSKSNVRDHFPDARKLIIVGKNTEQEISDIKMTRYACYLTAINGDPRKEQIAFAQAYFVIQTRKVELIEQRMEEFERISERKTKDMNR